MKEIWLESAVESLNKAKRMLYVGDYKNACINSRISATKAIYSALADNDDVKYRDEIVALYEIYKLKNGKDEEIEKAVFFLSRFILYEDIVTPYLAEKWEGLPTKEDAEKAVNLAEKLIEKISNLR
uniref:HEPN domain-containing protein n=1 Tax=candidate division WOR-3 bacterium TaxID=2052148 RepID=A0A7V3ZWA2_UNCW3